MISYKSIAAAAFFGMAAMTMTAQTDYTSYVNPFVGTTNYGTTNPGALVPNGLMQAVPFNVMGSKENRFDKDSRWWSTPYDVTNKYFTGYAHVALSGVGCPTLARCSLWRQREISSPIITNTARHIRRKRLCPDIIPTS